MQRITQEEFEKRYGTQASQFGRLSPSNPALFNFKSAGDVFQRAADDINTSKGMGMGSRVATQLIQGGLSIPRAIGAGLAETETGKKVTESVIGGLSKFGDVITPESVKEKVGDLATRTMEGFQSMTPEEQLTQRNKLGVAEALSTLGGGTAAREAVVSPVATVAKETTEQLAKRADDTLKNARSLKETIRTYVGGKTVDPQLQTSAERASVPPPFIKGTIAREPDVIKRYDQYLQQSERALEDIKVDPAIAEVGSSIGDAFNKIIADRRQVGKQLGDTLKEVGKFRVSVEEGVNKLLKELDDGGLSYNPKTRQLNIFQGTKFAQDEVNMLQDFLNRYRMLGNAPTVSDIDNFISRTRSELDFTKGKSGVMGTTNAERIINGGIASLRESLNPEVNGIVQLNNYWKLNQLYSDLSDFVKEGSQYLGKLTQAGDFAKDASVAKSAVQSILNNGKKDWLIKLEGLTGYNALDDAVIALQAMKDAGDYRGLSLLQAIKDGGVPTSTSGITQRILDKGIELGARAVAGKPSDQTRAFLKSIKKPSSKIPDKKVQAPSNIPKTKEIKALEQKIAQNVDAQKKAIKAGDFELVQKLKKIYTQLVESLTSLVREVRDEMAGQGERGFIANPLVRDTIKSQKPSNPRNRNITKEAKEALKSNPDGDIEARMLLEAYVKGKANSASRTELATAIDMLSGQK